MLCITHLPQVASAAAAHFVVSKSVVGGRTISALSPVESREREKEIARMLGSRSGEGRARARPRIARRMNRALLAGGLALGAMLLESSPFAWPVESLWRECLASAMLLPAREMLAAVEMPGKEIDPLSAALVLRAVLPLEPKGVVFVDPVTPDANAPLLVSKLGDARAPVIFSTADSLEVLPNVSVAEAVPEPEGAGAFTPDGFPAGAPGGRGQIVVRGGRKAAASSILRAFTSARNIALAGVIGSVPGWMRAGELRIPMEVDGSATLNPQAKNAVERMGLESLLMREERSERGEIGADLDAFFRGRWVVVQIVGAQGATCLAGLLNGFVETSPPAWISVLGVVLVMGVQGFPERRRMAGACFASGVWLVLALAIYGEFHFVVPLFPAIVMPLIAVVTAGFFDGRNRRRLGALASEAHA